MSVLHGSVGLPRFEQRRGAASLAARATRIAARPIQRAARAPAADGQTRAAHPRASSSPPEPAPVPIVSCTGNSLLERELAVPASPTAHPIRRRAPSNRPRIPSGHA